MGLARKKVITFFLSDTCNMKCIYCTLHSSKLSKSLAIDLEFAKCGIDDYFHNGFFGPEEKKGIRFFSSGEPTLEFGHMKAIYDYALEVSKGQLFVEIQTNGYFEDDVAQWIAEHVDLCWVSLDGLEDIQNKQRPTLDNQKSFGVVDRNVKMISLSSKTKLGLRPTTTAHNLDRQKELIDYGKANGVVAIYTDPWAHFFGTLEGQPDLMDFANRFIEAWNYANSVGMPYGSEFTANFDEATTVYCRAMLAAPSFAPDGCVTTCDMVNREKGFLPRLFPFLIIGKYNALDKLIDYFPDHIEKIKTRNIENLKDCKKCAALEFCAGGCLGPALVYSRDFYGVNKQYCAVTKYLFKRMPHLINAGYNPDIPEHP